MGNVIPFPAPPAAALRPGQAVLLDDGRAGSVLRIYSTPGGPAESLCVILDHMPTVVDARTVRRAANSLKELNHDPA